MDSKKGTKSISGNIGNYTQKIASLSNNSIYTLTDVHYRVYLSLKNGDKAQGRITIGHYQTSIIYFRYGLSFFVVPDKDKIIENYKNYGINGISPFQFNSNWSGEQSSEFSIIAECSVVPTISNLKIEATSIRQPIKVTWESERQEKYVINAKLDDKVIYTAQGNTEKTHTIPAHTLKEKDRIQIEVQVLYSDNGNLSSSAWAKEHTNLTIKDDSPNIKEIETTTLNVDGIRKIKWKSDDQDTYKLELNGAVYTGLKDKECLISIDHLHWGQNNAKLTLTNTINGITASVEKEFSFTVTADNPTITALDPNNVDVNIDKPVVITWNTVPAQSKFVLKANDTTYTGTTIMGVTVPVGVFNTNANTISVTATRYILGQILTGTKTVTFNGYGKPTAPTFDEKTIYNTALPVFHWTSKEQTAYQVQVIEGNNSVYIDSGEVVSTDSFYKVLKSLKNKTKYIVKAKIRSKFGLWSDYTQKEITTSFDVIAPATLTLFEDTDGGIIINTTNQDNAKFARSEVWRKDDFSDWKRIGYNLPLVSSFKDNTIASGIKYYYKAITFTQSGGASESEIKTYSMNIDRSFFVDIESNKSIYLGYSFSETQDIKIKRIQDRKTVLYQGKSAPDIEIGESDYKQISVNLAFKTYQEFKAFEYFIDSSKVLMFKDKIGRKIYCCVTSWGEEESNTFGFVGITLNLVEVNFIEKDIFDGGRKLRLIKLDEGWKLDTGLTVDMAIYE